LVAEKAFRPPALVMFADDWGRHPSSCQHLVGQLLGRFEVYWVNTIGTRTPRLDLATVRRGLEKIHQWLRPSGKAGPLPANLHVLNPRMWPWFSSATARKVNRTLLVRQLAPLIRSLPGPVLAVSTLPLVADLIGLLPVERWVYYCVDDFSQWPGLDQATLARMEETLVRRADSLIAVSETLRDKLDRMGRSAHLLTHGVDLDFWRTNGTGTAIPQLDNLQRPLIVFWGVTDRRMDVSFVNRLARDLSRGTVVLVGPQADPEPELFQESRVVHLPSLPFPQLPLLARRAEVLILPYADLPVTRAIQPLKLKEYLATGKPTVARSLPSTRGWADCLDLADTAESFSQAVRRRLAEGLPEQQQRARARRLAGESWAEKAREFERWILGREVSRNGAGCL
jgi:glycosyltransferase involved in cell wall biosynthesis